MKQNLLLLGAILFSVNGMSAADPIVVSPAAGSDIAAALTEAKAGKEVGKITINLAENAAYTLGASIETGAGLVINGNGATIDASALETPVILMSATPTVEVVNDFYRVDSVAVKNVTVNGAKSSIFYDNNTKYCVVDFVLDGVDFALATAAVENEALIAFKAGGAKDFAIKNSTIYGNGEGAKYFVRYNNNARIDRFGYDENVDTWSMLYTNNTFYKAIKNDGQWGNYNGVASKAKAMIVTVNKNIWFDCSEQVLRRMFQSKAFKDFNAGSSVAENTFWYNDAAAEQGNYGNGLELTTNPDFVNAAEGNFTIGASTEQAKYQTGAPKWLVPYSGESAIESIGVDNENAPVEYFNLQGIRVDNPAAGIFIRRQGSKVSKVVIK